MSEVVVFGEVLRGCIPLVQVGVEMSEVPSPGPVPQAGKRSAEISNAAFTELFKAVRGFSDVESCE